MAPWRFDKELEERDGQVWRVFELMDKVSAFISSLLHDGKNRIASTDKCFALSPLRAVEEAYHSNGQPYSSYHLQQSCRLLVDIKSPMLT